MERPHISREQFSATQKIAAQMRELVRARKQAIADGSTDIQFAQSSDIWEQGNELFSYCLDPSYEVVDVWRLHTIMFTGNYLSFVIPDPTNVPRRLEKRYRHFTNGLPPDMIVRPPNICAERGWEIDGHIINIDSVMYQRHMAALYRSGAMSYLRSLKHVRILEIGSGYGAFALAFKNIFPDAEYCMVDLPESLVFPAVYLSITAPHYITAASVWNGKHAAEGSLPASSAFMFVSNFLATEFLKGRKFDFIINTGSLGEMTEYQTDRYAELIANALDEGGIFYEENGDTNHYVPEVISRRLSGIRLINYERIWAHDPEVLERIKNFRTDIKIPFSVSLRNHLVNARIRLRAMRGVSR